MCKEKCKEKFTHAQRVQVFNRFYGLMDYVRQKDFICAHVVQKGTRLYLDAQMQPVKNKRQVTRQYFLCTEKGAKVKVCKAFLWQPWTLV